MVSGEGYNNTCRNHELLTALKFSVKGNHSENEVADVSV